MVQFESPRHWKPWMVQSELKATQCYLNLVFVDLSVSRFDRSTGWINLNLAVSSRTSFLLLSLSHLMMFPFDQTHLFFPWMTQTCCCLGLYQIIQTSALISLALNLDVFDSSKSLLVDNERWRVSNVLNPFTHDCFNGATTHEPRNTGNKDWLFIR